MRLLHTSDWHLGRSFHREDLLQAQASFVDRLVETVRSERVDVVLVAGDVFDRALPSVDAVLVAHDALRRLAATGARTVVTSGNHDSARRLGFGAELIDAAGVHLRTDVRGVGVPVLLEDRHGPVAVYGLPYLEPALCCDALGVPERSHAAVLAAAATRVRDDLAARPAGTRSVVLAHAFVTGGEACESERDISVGGVSGAPLSTFDGFDYVALGHLHGRQTLAEAVRYSGSPLPYSFSEEHHTKGMWLVDLDRTGVAAVAPVDLAPPRPLARLRGRIDDLLGEPRWAAYERHYLQVTLTDPVRPREPMERLRSRFPHTLVLGFEPEGGDAIDSRSYTERLRGLDDLDVCCSFVEHVRRSPADPDEVAVLREALEALRVAEASA
jgi:exonuclease SbcD